ncbi:MAG: hypothetical protein JNK87_16970 [Bryobacterales bacterium]|nr:hypothetical protein [Bryobacterales bacterium]
MRFLSLILCLPTIAPAGVLMSGSAGSNGVHVNYSTRLEPGTPAISKHGGGTLTKDGVIKRHLCNFDNGTYSGFDLTMERLPSGKVRLRFAPLTMTPEEMKKIFPKVDQWKPLPLPAAPATLEVNPGETVALDLFVNPSTGQKVTEYLTVQSDQRLVVTVDGPARDFRVTDVELDLTAPRVSVDGKQAFEFAGAMRGPALWLDLPGHGRHVFSLVPRPDLGMQRLGEIRGTTLQWKSGGHTYAVSTARPVLPGEQAYHLYVSTVPRSVESFGISSGPHPDWAIRQR